MTTSAARIIFDSTDLTALTESNPHFAGLTSDQRFWYRMAMLDVTSMLANDLMPCEDVDTQSVNACLEAIHEWYSQLRILSDHLDR